MKNLRKNIIQSSLILAISTSKKGVNSFHKNPLIRAFCGFCFLYLSNMGSDYVKIDPCSIENSWSICMNRSPDYIKKT